MHGNFSSCGYRDRFQSGTSASARVALLYSRGEIRLNEPKRFEGPLGTCFIGQAVSAKERNGVTFVTPRITGNAYITGYHQFVLDQNDPIPGGYRVDQPRMPYRLNRVNTSNTCD